MMSYRDNLVLFEIPYLQIILRDLCRVDIFKDKWIFQDWRLFDKRTWNLLSLPVKPQSTKVKVYFLNTFMILFQSTLWYSIHEKLLLNLNLSYWTTECWFICQDLKWQELIAKRFLKWWFPEHTFEVIWVTVT